MKLPVKFLELSPNERAIIIKKINERLADLDSRLYPNVIGEIGKSSQSLKNMVDFIITQIFADDKTDLGSVLNYIENEKYRI